MHLFQTLNAIQGSSISAFIHFGSERPNKGVYFFFDGFDLLSLFYYLEVEVWVLLRVGRWRATMVILEERVISSLPCIMWFEFRKQLAKKFAERTLFALLGWDGKRMIFCHVNFSLIHRVLLFLRVLWSSTSSIHASPWGSDIVDERVSSTVLRESQTSRWESGILLITYC